ncbi:MAG: polysaccharide biosynthesis tyrosine autokinase [Cyclobacteriaceae bacterium]|nr:polysaccharide biosynthesis tyrosine autokinase [Cyclobacteriaceae bacterium]
MNPLEFENIDQKANKPVDYKKYFLKLLRRWYFILPVFFLFLGGGYMVNRYATPVYGVNATIITKKFSTSNNQDVLGFSPASYILSGMTEVYEEIPLLKSYSRIRTTIDRLNFDVSYYSKGLVKTTETMRGFGFEVKIDTLSGKDVPYGVPLVVKQESENSFRILCKTTKWEAQCDDRIFQFDEPIQLGDITFRVKKNYDNIVDDYAEHYFVFNSREALVNEYRRKLNISWVQQGSAMLALRINSDLPDKELAFLSTYCRVIEEIGLEDKNQYLTNTIRFIEDQMAMLTDSIVHYQEIIDDLKLQNTDLNFEADMIYSKLSALDEDKSEILLSERYFSYLENYIKENRGSEVFAPNLIGLDAPLLSGLVHQYITGKMEEQYTRNNDNSKNPLMNKVTGKRTKLEKNIFEAINSYRQKNREDLRELNRKRGFLMSSVKDMQKDFREVDRQNRLYEINKNLFDMFLTRKAEATITRASSTSDYEIVSGPAFSPAPIHPDKQLNLGIAAVLGLVLPVGLFLLKDITNKYVNDKDDLERYTDIPLLGNVAHSTSDDKIIMRTHSRSVSSEAFRALRANVRFLVGNGTKESKVFLVTSSVSGEGKTFCSINMAYTFALSGKKTLIIGADLRKPAMTRYLDAKQSAKGLSEYLADMVKLEDIISKGEDGNDNLYFISSGAIPPNPSELLGSEKVKDMLNTLREKFDYIIIDTPPVGLISDALSLIHHVDYSFLIVRQGVTEKAALKMINELYLDEKLTKVSVIFNDLKITKGKSYYGGYMYGMGYGGYGYGYYAEDK